MLSLVYFVFAAFLEIAGCFAFWAWVRGGRPAWVVIPGIASLALFALCALSDAPSCRAVRSGTGLADGSLASGRRYALAHAHDR